MKNYDKYRFEIPLGYPEGIFSGVIEDVDIIADGGEGGGAKVQLTVTLDNDMEIKFSMPINTKLAWKIKNLFVSAGVADSCVSNGKLITMWELLIGKVVYMVLDNRGIRNFITREEFLSRSGAGH